MTKFERKTASILDSLTTNPWTAFPIFILIVYLLFWCTFYLGRFPMEWIDSLVRLLSAYLGSVLSPLWLRDLVVDGILAGVGGVLMFLPNIVILYLLISVMESTGYMGRVAFIMDTVMHRMGLHGKSFVPMIMGFGCNVPAILACRNIQSGKSRIVTSMIIPFMSCSGRLPVYLLLLAAFFPEHGPLILLGVYFLGMLLAALAAKILSVVVPGISEHDHVEIKPYMAPQWSFVFSNTWEQVREYARKLAGPILLFSIALWLLGYFPRAAEGSSHFQQKEQSYIGKVGHAVEPVLEPIGMNWKDGVALISGVGAKELIVSTLGVMYSDSSDSSLQQLLRRSHSREGALSFIVFVLLYFPCVGTFVALRHVTGSWGWTVVSAVNSILVAWIMAFAAFNLSALPMG